MVGGLRLGWSGWVNAWVGWACYQLSAAGSCLIARDPMPCSASCRRLVHSEFDSATRTSLRL